MNESEPRIAIATAWKPELNALHDLLPESVEVHVPSVNTTYYHNNIDGIQVVYFESGVGMTDSAITTSDVLNRYPITHLVIAGVAGSLTVEAPPTSICIPDNWKDASRQLYARPSGNGWNRPSHMDKFIEGPNFGMIHPMKTKGVLIDTSMMDRAKEISSHMGDSNPVVNPKPDVIIGGQGLSSSIFMDNPDYREFLQDLYPDARIVDMESYAILRACIRRDMPVLSIAIRAITDTAGNPDITDNELSSNLEKATYNLTAFVSEYIKNLGQAIHEANSTDV